MVTGCPEKRLAFGFILLSLCFGLGREANQNLVNGSSRLKVDFGACINK